MSNTMRRTHDAHLLLSPAVVKALKIRAAKNGSNASIEANNILTAALYNEIRELIEADK